MITCDAFIAESCGPASFGRHNYFATNFGRRLFVPSFPYLLQATFVVVLRTPTNTPIEDLELTLTSSWGQSFTNHLGTFPAADREACNNIEWSRLDTTILGEGSFTLACEFKGYAWSANWQVISGVGPLRQGPTALPGAALLDGRRSWNPLADLAREVRSSIFLADPYATPEFLESLLTPGPCPWQCKVLIGERGAVAAPSWQALRHRLPLLEVRADTLIHDRFVLRDDEEAFAFGHSFKDLDRGRVSFFSRVYDHEQFTLIRAALNESWDRATVVL